MSHFYEKIYMMNDSDSQSLSIHPPLPLHTIVEQESVPQSPSGLFGAQQKHAL